jgi:flagellar basal-body rod protein FlgB
MLEKLFGPHADRLNRAMSRTSERQSLLVNNLANVNTPGYKRQDADFHILLEAEMTDFDQAVANRKGPRGIPGDNSMRVDGNSVDLEYEVMSIAETEARYSALTEMTSRYFSGLKNVIKEGR